MSNNETEHHLWNLINGLGWWFWGTVALLAAINLFNLYRLAAAATLYGRIIRIVAFTGFLLIAVSPLNTAFGPLGLPLVLLSYLGVTHQMYMQCLAAGKIIRVPEATMLVRAAAMIVQPK